MSARWRNILSRFPAHMEAARENKEFQSVVEALAQNLDTLSSAIGRVRKAHRLGDADETRDLFLLGGLHDFQRSEAAVLVTRFALTTKLLATAAGSDDDAIAVGMLWSIAAPGFRLDSYAVDQPATPAKARARFVAAARKAIRTEAFVDALRQRIATVAETHAQGNGTVHALATGAANAIDCEVLSIAHSTDRYLHRAKVRDRLTLTAPKLHDGVFTDEELAPAEEQVLIEENPQERRETGADPRVHGQLFSVIRRGFERTDLRVIVTGTGGRTIGPMVVNRDEGAGVGFADVVPEGSTLVLNEEGRALLDGLDVTSRAFGWKGACFAEADHGHRNDFVFGGDGAPATRMAKFAEATPPGSLDAMFAFPHAGDNISHLGIDVGENRFAFFVQEGFFSYQDPGGTTKRVQPRPAVAFADRSVFAPGPGEERQTAGLVSLSWLERCAFRARIWIPQRFRQLTPDDAEGLATRRQVLEAVERFRPAGVRLDVDFIDNRWVLGRGVVFDSDTPVADLAPGIGMELWSAPEENHGN
jgi:hypothetical protein